MSKPRCGSCNAEVSSDETRCPGCGHINKHPNPDEWKKTRKQFIEVLKQYIPQCPPCGAYLLGDEECDIFEDEGILGPGEYQFGTLAVRSFKRADRCIYCEDID